MKLTIKITKEVLRKSMFCIFESDDVGVSCAFGLAIHDLLPNSFTFQRRIIVGLSSWQVDGSSFEIADDESHPKFKDLAVIKLPYEATMWIKDFDHCSPRERSEMPEASFNIDLPESIIDSIGIEEAKEIISKSSTLELVSPS